MWQSDLQTSFVNTVCIFDENLSKIGGTDIFRGLSPTIIFFSTTHGKTAVIANSWTNAICSTLFFSKHIPLIFPWCSHKMVGLSWFSHDFFHAFPINGGFSHAIPMIFPQRPWNTRWNGSSSYRSARSRPSWDGSLAWHPASLTSKAGWGWDWLGLGQCTYKLMQK